MSGEPKMVRVFCQISAKPEEGNFCSNLTAYDIPLWVKNAIEMESLKQVERKIDSLAFDINDQLAFRRGVYLLLADVREQISRLKNGEA